MNESYLPAEISEAAAGVLSNYKVTIVTANTTKTTTQSAPKEVRVKRPMNAFMVWAQEARKQMAAQHPNLHNAELSKTLGQLWKKINSKDKEPFIREADRLRQIHKQQNPDYKYQPKRRNSSKKQSQTKKERKPDVQRNESKRNNSSKSINIATADRFSVQYKLTSVDNLKKMTVGQYIDPKERYPIQMLTPPKTPSSCDQSNSAKSAIGGNSGQPEWSNHIDVTINFDNKIDPDIYFPAVACGDELEGNVYNKGVTSANYYTHLFNCSSECWKSPASLCESRDKALSGCYSQAFANNNQH